LYYLKGIDPARNIYFAGFEFPKHVLYFCSVYFLSFLKAFQSFTTNADV